MSSDQRVESCFSVFDATPLLAKIDMPTLLVVGSEDKISPPAEMRPMADAIPGADAVVHLAGLSAVGPSFADPQGYLEQNSAMVTHLGEALVRARSSARAIDPSSFWISQMTPAGLSPARRARSMLASV